jgi:1,4-alpha-glucan branching enzyme
MIELKSPSERAALREAGLVVAAVLALLAAAVAPGVTTRDLDRLAEAEIRRRGGEPVFKGYQPHPRQPAYPGSVCVSINDEVVHGKHSLVGKMPGGHWQQVAHLRLLLAYQMLLPGKKLIFMGNEFGQEREWIHDQSLDWHLIREPEHQGVADLVRDLNYLYRDEPSLAHTDADPAAFRWVAADDADASVFAWLRMEPSCRPILAVMNATPVPRHHYRVGVPTGGHWAELLNTDAQSYGGGGMGNLGGTEAIAGPWHGLSAHLALTLPPLSLIVLAPGTPSGAADI